MHITQYFECSVIFHELQVKCGEAEDGVSISWLSYKGARLVDALCAASLAFWVRPFPMVDVQFCRVAMGSFLTLILLGWDSLLLFGPVIGTKFLFSTFILGLHW